MGNTCSSIGAGPSSSSPLHGRGLPANDNEERKFPPASDADAQLAIVLQNRATREAAGASPVCLHASTSQPQLGPGGQRSAGAAVRTQLLARVENLGQQLLQFLPYRDLSMLAATAGGFRALISQRTAYLNAMAVHSHLVNPLADKKLLNAAHKEMREFMQQEQALLEKAKALMEYSGWPIRTVVKLMSQLSLERFARYSEIDGLLRKAEAGTISQKEQRWLCFSLTDFEPPALVEEAIAEAAQGNRDSLRDLAMRTAINYCVLEVHDLAERSECLKAQEDELKLLPKHSIASLKVKFAHVKERDAIHHLSNAQRGQLAALAAGLAALRDEDPRPPGLFQKILGAMERLHDSDRARNGTIQTSRLLAMGFESELNEHLVECDEWIRLCSTEPIDLERIDLHKVGMAWGRAGLPVAALQTMSEAIRLAHHDKGAALHEQLNVLRKGLLVTATASLIDHYAVDSNPTVSFSSSPPANSPMAANEFTFTYVDPVTGKAYPAQTYVHAGDKLFARKFFVTNERGEIIHVRTHVFNARPQRAPRNQQAPSGIGDTQVVMHFDESKAHRAT